MTDYIYSIEANNVNKTFKRKNTVIKALNDFNIKIKKGSIHGLLGPNGAGKSTFINILGSLVKKDTGNIKICGVDIDENLKLSKFKIPNSATKISRSMSELISAESKTLMLKQTSI